jgi:hypothetical protein
MEIPVSHDHLLSPDLLFRVIERWKLVSMHKPEEAKQEHRNH